MNTEDRDRLLELASKWEAAEYFSGAFYPEATAYDDGQRVRAEVCAEELRELLGVSEPCS